MPQPKFNNAPDITPVNKDVSFDFFDVPVEEFEEVPEKENDESDILDFEIDNDSEQESIVSPQKRRSQANKSAERYVNMMSRTFASVAAASAHSESKEFMIDKDAQDEIADPLSDLIYEKQIIDLPPGWAVAIASVVAFYPMTLKAMSMRKENKALKEAETKIIELNQKVDKKKDVENDD